GRDALAAVQEERACQKAGDGAADPALEAAVLHAVLIILAELGHIFAGDGPPVCAPGQGRDDLRRANLLRVGAIGVAAEDALAARGRTDALGVEWAPNLKGIHAIQPIL